jgi:uncharacterized protein DUF6152
MNTRTLALAGLAASLFGAPALAHHSFAMFDATKSVTLNGTVKSLEWTNPHMWLNVLVEQSGGQPVLYQCEMQGIAGAVKFGWTRDIVKPGDKVSFVIHPLRDGHAGGQLLDVVLADGKKLNVMAAPAPRTD